MKVLNILVAVLMLSPTAFAQSDTSVEVFEQEQGAMSEDAAAALTPMMQPMGRSGSRRGDRDRGEEIIGSIIGIIGAIAAERIGGDHRYRDRLVTCYARDRWGNVYRATARNANRAQWRALDKCEEYARFCREAGCHVH